METVQAFPPISLVTCGSTKNKKIKRQQRRNRPRQKPAIISTTASPFSKPSSPTPLLIDLSPLTQTKHQVLDEVLKEIQASIDRGIAIQPKVFSSLLETCYRTQSLHHGVLIHRLMPPKLLRKSVDLSSKLLRLYASFGHVDIAHRLFDQMPQRHATAFAWNSLISGYAEVGLYEDAMALYYQMDEDGVEPDRFTFPRVLKACAGLGSIQTGEAVHRHIVRSGFASDPFILNALVDMYAKCGDIVKARKIFNMIHQRDSISWNSMLGGYVRHDLLFEAMIIFRQMIAVGFEPDSVAISTILARFPASRLGFEIHGWVIRQGLDMNLSVANSLISMYGEMGRLDLARELFDGMVERDTVSWNAIISAHKKDAQQALMIFGQMENSGVLPDAITFISLLSALAHSGTPEDGWQLFAEMEGKFRIRPQVEHYACMVNLLGRAGFVDEAYEFIKEKMACEGGPTAWGALLYACLLHRNITVGKMAAERLFELEPDNAYNFELMMKIYEDAGRWEEAEYVRRMMMDRGLDS